MGKSMQGAGGALVFAAVFESIIKRTRLVSSMQAQSPERWLKGAFQELQAVFEGFDCSMLVSAVIGLLDDRAGLLYLIEAEHPETVLLRNGKADFVKSEAQYRKLGWTVSLGRIQVGTIQLLPGDILLAGSDGRDDLAIGMDASGERIINEDERGFIEIVERAAGSLAGIRKGLSETGELIDDLSLIRIGFLENEKSKPVRKVTEHIRKARSLISAQNYRQAAEILDETLLSEPRNSRALKLRAQLFYMEGSIAPALDLSARYLALRPGDTEMLYLASTLLRENGKLNDAVEYGERVRLRKPDHLRNLIGLARSYKMLQNGRSRKIAEEILTLEPENALAREIVSALPVRYN